MPASYNGRTTPLAQNATNPLAASMRLAYDFTGHDTRPRWQPYDWVGATQPTAIQNTAPTFITYNAIPGLQYLAGDRSARYFAESDYGLAVGAGDYTACVLFSTGPSLPNASGAVSFASISNAGFNSVLIPQVIHDSGVGWICASPTCGSTVSGQGRTYFGANKTVAMFIRRVSGVASCWRVILGDDPSAQRVTSDTTTASSAIGDFNTTNASTLDFLFSGSNPANTPALHSFRFHGAAFTEAEMFSYANTWWEIDAFTAPPVITGPTGAAGAASITHTVPEGQNSAGVWTGTGSEPLALAATGDGPLLTITGGNVTRTAGPFDFEAKPIWNFRVVKGASFQDVTLNLSNLPELSNPTRSTPTSATVAPGLTVDTTTGTVRCIVIESPTQPSAPNVAQVKAGLNAAGTSAGVTVLPNLTINSAGAKQFVPTTIPTTGKTYWPFAVLTVGSDDSAVLAGLPHYPGTGRAVADVSVSGWTPTGAASNAAAINEDTSNRSTFTTGPAVSSTPALATYALDKPYPPGTYSFSVDADIVSGTGKLRVKFFNDAGTLLGTSADQTLTPTAQVFTFNITVAGGTATRWGHETEA
jgi:hypothetical protein